MKRRSSRKDHLQSFLPSDRFLGANGLYGFFSQWRIPFLHLRVWHGLSQSLFSRVGRRLSGSVLRPGLGNRWWYETHTTLRMNATASARDKGDFDIDSDVDGSDLAVFARDFGRTDCCFGGAEPCEGDFDGDCDAGGTDLAMFAKDFGRIDCPVPLIQAQPNSNFKVDTGGSKRLRPIPLASRLKFESKFWETICNILTTCYRKYK